MTRARPFQRHFARKFRPLAHTGLPVVLRADGTPAFHHRDRPAPDKPGRGD
jgi:hypothetical protein